jgi:hypothetical protein
MQLRTYAVRFCTLRRRIASRVQKCTARGALRQRRDDEQAPVDEKHLYGAQRQREPADPPAVDEMHRQASPPPSMRSLTFAGALEADCLHAARSVTA